MAPNSEEKNHRGIEKLVFTVSILAFIYSVLSNSYIDINGFLTNDSTHFLRLAQSLKDGNGFSVYSWTNSGDSRFFSTWPIGYPFSIYLLSKISHLDVFWSSKFINIIAGILIIFSVKRYVKSGFSLIPVIFIWGSFINIFSYTMTESLFGLGLVLYILRLHELEISQSKKNLIYAFFAFVLAFTSRYIGAYLLVFNFLYLIWAFKKNQSSFKHLVLLLLYCSIYVAAYLSINKISSGFTTYSHAYLTYESSYEISIQFIKKMFEELNLIMASVRFSSNPISASLSSILSLYLIYYIYKYLKEKEVVYTYLNKLSNKLIASGVLYILVVFVWRLIIWFSPFSYRILFPSLLLIGLGIILKILSKKQIWCKDFNKIYIILCCIGAFSFSFNVLYKQISYNEINYNQNVAKIMEKYKKIKDGSAVIFGERQLDYKRSDIVPLKPYYLPLFSKVENKNEFNERISRFNEIYFNIPLFCKKPYNTLSGDRNMNCISENKKIHFFDKEIIGFIKENSKKNIFKINQIK
ncbi:MAG: hypothetical protein VX343_03710 [Thermodesulfobacteriota bacterium]|nr:hypothetical protein [Thermodesulfobacteriota bacterium]